MPAPVVKRSGLDIKSPVPGLHFLSSSPWLEISQTAGACGVVPSFPALTSSISPHTHGFLSGHHALFSSNLRRHIIITVRGLSCPVSGLHRLVPLHQTQVIFSPPAEYIWRSHTLSWLKLWRLSKQRLFLFHSEQMHCGTVILWFWHWKCETNSQIANFEIKLNL